MSDVPLCGMWLTNESNTGETMQSWTEVHATTILDCIDLRLCSDQDRNKSMRSYSLFIGFGDSTVTRGSTIECYIGTK